MATETDFVRREQVRLIVADIPFLAGDIAARTGILCIGISNFTWDWILALLLAGDSTLDLLRQSYGKFDYYLRLPFSHPLEVSSPEATRVESGGHLAATKPCTIEVPLVATRSQQAAELVLERLGLDPGDTRCRVFLGMRAPVSGAVLAAAARANPEFCFLSRESYGCPLPENVRRVPQPDLTYHDVLAVSDAVVSKLGYGTVSACVANRTGILFPAREGFREDGLLREGAARYLRARELPLQDFLTGAWGPHLRALQALREPAERLEINGADVCADILEAKMQECSGTTLEQ